MVKKLTDKNLLVFLHYLLDILDVIETLSLEFQKPYCLLVDQAKNLEALTSSLIKIGNHNGGYYVQKFLDNCKCGEEQEKCSFLMKYEINEEVRYDGIELKINKKKKKNNVEKPLFPDLSEVGQDIGKALSEEIFNRIPAESMQLFDVLNPLSWPADQKYPFSGFVQYRDDDLVKLYRMVFASDSFDMRVDDDTLIKDWREMLGALTNDADWCKMLRSNDLAVLWQHYLHTDKIPPTMKRVIRHVLAVPVGSADVERAFSILSHIRDQRRSRLTPKHIEGLLRIRINGPSTDKFLPLKYAKTWKGLNTGDPLGQRRKAKVTTEDDGDDLVPARNENDDEDLDPDGIEEPVEPEDEIYGAKESDIDTSDIKSPEFRYMDDSPLF